MNRAIYAVCIAAALTLMLFAPPAYAACTTVTVSRAKVADIPKLLADAVCFEKLAATTSAAHLASAKIRRDRIAVLQAPPPAPTTPPSFTVDDNSVTENAGFVSVKVRKHGSTSTNPSMVRFSTADGPAIAGSDYTATSLDITFGPTEYEKLIPVTTIDDAVVESQAEGFTVNLQVISNARLADGTATINILDNDVPLPPPPTDGGLPSLPAIASNFDINTELVPAWGTGAIAPSMAPDNVGAFRFICNPAHLSYDDPIVYPGQPGKSHLHQFFGNTKVDAFSTYESLRTTGESTCMSPLNRSGYWIPAMMNGAGQVVRPDYVAIYYKRRPASDPKCQPGTLQTEGTCVDLPRGLRYIFGYDMIAHAGQSTIDTYYINCAGAGATQGFYPNIPAALPFCPAAPTSMLILALFSPPCWDGKNLDSPDHRSHMAHMFNTGQGYHRCPDTHPYVVPQFSLQAAYTADASLGSWHLSSDVMPGMPTMPGGTTLHADWFGAWDDAVLKMWHDNCINKMLSGAGGDLCNGQMMRTFTGFSWTANPRLVAVPPKP